MPLILLNAELLRDVLKFILKHACVLFSLIAQVARFISKVTLLASGGAGHIYPTTTNPPVSFMKQFLKQSLAMLSLTVHDHDCTPHDLYSNLSMMCSHR